jgi:hypothetical protein
MDIDPETAASLGFAKIKYLAIEHERRWLCDAVPRELVDRTEAISDLYVTGTQIRKPARSMAGHPCSASRARPTSIRTRA